jgi:hypothetical protein
MTAWRSCIPRIEARPACRRAIVEWGEVTEASPRVDGTVAFGRMKELSDAGAT